MTDFSNIDWEWLHMTNIILYYDLYREFMNNEDNWLKCENCPLNYEPGTEHITDRRGRSNCNLILCAVKH